MQEPTVLTTQLGGFYNLNLHFLHFFHEESILREGFFFFFGMLRKTHLFSYEEEYF